MNTMLSTTWTWAKARLGVLGRENGAGLAEYILLVGFIAVMIVGIVIGFRTVLGGAIQQAGQNLSQFK